MPETTQPNTVPDFAIVGGVVYRAAAINSVDPIAQTEDVSHVLFSLGGERIKISFNELEEAEKAHRLLVYLMTGTDLYAKQAQGEEADAEAEHQEETGA